MSSGRMAQKLAVVWKLLKRSCCQQPQASLNSGNIEKIRQMTGRDEDLVDMNVAHKLILPRQPASKNMPEDLKDV